MQSQRQESLNFKNAHTTLQLCKFKKYDNHVGHPERRNRVLDIAVTT